MRLAVFSDIHSNEPALSAAMAYADHVGVDGYVFLGDLLTDCPYPRRTLDLIRAASRRRPAWVLRGNREDYLIRHHDKPAEHPFSVSSETGSILYTYQNITEDDLAYLRDLPIAQVVELPGCPPILLAHAAPDNNAVLLYPGSEVLDTLLKKCPQSTIVSGHSHIQFRYESGGRQFINPGTVGLAKNGQGKAQFALLSCLAGRWSARLMNVDYDRALVLRQFDESGLMAMGGVWTLAVMRVIQQGGTYTTDCLQLARKLAGMEHGMPESCWEEAAHRLGLLS